MSQGQEKIIIGIAGELLAGKSTAAEFYIKTYDAKHYKFSRIIDQVLDMLDIPVNRKSEQDMGALMKELYGEGVWANALAMNALHNGHTFLLFDGLRKVEEVLVLKQELPRFHLVYIDAPLELRYQRSKLRDEKPGENTQNFEQFKASELHAADIDIKRLRDYADHVITNNGTLEEFHLQLSRIVNGELMR